MASACGERAVPEARRMHGEQEALRLDAIARAQLRRSETKARCDDKTFHAKQVMRDGVESLTAPLRKLVTPNIQCMRVTDAGPARRA